MPDVLSSLEVRVMRQESQSLDDRFVGSIEASAERDPDLVVKVRIEGWKENWSHVAGRFIPQIYTSHLIVEVFDASEGRPKETDRSLELLKNLDLKLNRYLWHTAG